MSDGSISLGRARVLGARGIWMALVLVACHKPPPGTAHGVAVKVVPVEKASQSVGTRYSAQIVPSTRVDVAFKLGGILKHTTEMYSFVTSFGLAMNPAFYDKLPADLKKLVDDSVTGKEKEIGEGWDSIDGTGRKALMDGGMQPIRLSPEEDAKFRKAGGEVVEAKLKELDGKGLPARPAYAMMKSLAEKHEKTSRNFWKQ